MELTLRIAMTFKVSVDYLIRDDYTSEITSFKNKQFLEQMKEVDNLPKEDQKTIISFLDAFIKRRKFEKLIQN